MDPSSILKKTKRKEKKDAGGVILFGHGMSWRPIEVGFFNPLWKFFSLLEIETGLATEWNRGLWTVKTQENW